MGHLLSADRRNAIYDDLHGRQLVAEEAANYRSAERILDILLRHYRPRSALDVGCGLGTWLRVLVAKGVQDVMGIDGQWLDPSRLQVPQELTQVHDLERPFDLERRFDLVISLEVAEHLSEAAAADFVASLVRHAPAVLFSAAIPHQGGHHHVNERFLSYWIGHFARFGYRPVDFIRGEIWDSPEVLWWLRQNTIFFACADVLAASPKLNALADSHAPLSVVHPELYLRAHEQVAGAGQLLNLIAGGGLFRVTKDEGGRLTVSKVDAP